MDVNKEAGMSIGNYIVDQSRAIGCGTFGAVFKGFHIATETLVSIKKITIDYNTDNILSLRVFEEIKMYERLKGHPNILQFYDFSYGHQSFWLVMEFCELGSLDEYMKNTTAMSEKDKYLLMSQCSEALAYLHTLLLPIVHRNIKPNNILIQNKQGGPEIKLADFGVSKMVTVNYLISTFHLDSSKESQNYMAPELFKNEKYNHKVDVFSMGLLFAGMLNHKKGEQLYVKGSSHKPPGKAMVDSHKRDTPMPVLVVTDIGDSTAVSNIKQMVKTMLEFLPEKRPEMTVVAETIKKSHGNISETKTVSGMMLSRLGDPGEGQSSDDEQDEKKNDLGMEILKQTLNEEYQTIVSSHKGLDIRKKTRVTSTLEILQTVLVDTLFDVGEEVIIDEDPDKVMRLQMDHAAWNPRLKQYVGEKGIVVKADPFHVQVKFKDGRQWSFTPALVHKLPPEVLLKLSRSDPKSGRVDFNEHDVIRITDKQIELERLQHRVGLWQSRLETLVGSTGLVLSVDYDGVVMVRCMTRESIFFHPAALQKLDPDEKTVRSGDLVYIINNQVLVEQHQKQLKLWKPAMIKLLGSDALVKRIGKNYAVLEFEDGTWKFSLKTILLIAKNGDIVNAVHKKKRNNEEAKEKACKHQ